MILVTGATGNIGRALVRELGESGAQVRAITRDASPGRIPAGVDVVEGDLADPESIKHAFDGIAKLFLLLGTGDPKPVLETAAKAGVGHVVLVSTLLAQTHPNSFIGQTGLSGESAARENGLDWTVLRPWELMSNVLDWATEIREHGLIRKPRSGVPSPAVHPADIAAVAAQALQRDGHAGKIYPLTGPAELTAVDKARTLGAALGRTITFEDTHDPAALEELARQAPDAEAAALIIPGIAALNSPGVLPTVHEVTGRPARTFAQWAEENAAAFR